MKKYAFITLSLILFGAWFYTGETEESIREHNPLDAEVINTSAAAVSSLYDSTSSTATVNQALVTPPIQNKPESGELPPDYKIWKQSRGIFSDEELQEYEGFKLDKLEELANKGDLKAIEVLKKFELSSGNHKRYNELVDLAAVHGSLKSIRLLTTKKFGEYTTSRKEEDILEMFAYVSLAEKRGDLYFKHQKTKTYSKFFNFYPNEEQQKHIDKRSDELMADLEARRKELGLPPFDNSPLESDRRKYEFMNEDADN